MTGSSNHREGMMYKIFVQVLVSVSLSVSISILETSFSTFGTK